MPLQNLNAQEIQRQEAIKMAIETLASSPGILKPCGAGKEIAEELSALADGILAYIKKPL